MPHVCPWPGGYFMHNPIRRLFHNPAKIVGPYVKPGMTVMDVGCGMGFCSITMAKIVGDSGHVIAVDLQQKMLDVLRQRATMAGVANRIRLHKCEQDRLGVDAQADFALAFMMVHEVPDQRRLLRFGERQRGLDADDSGVHERARDQDPALQQELPDLESRQIVDELDADQQALPAHVHDDVFVAAHGFAQTGQESFAEHRGAFRKPLLDEHVDRGERHRAGHRVPAERRRVQERVAEQPREDRFRPDDGTGRHHAAAERLGQAHDVGRDAAPCRCESHRNGRNTFDRGFLH